MGLSHDILSQLAKVVKEDKKQNTESIVYGTVKTDANGNKYVQLDGSDQLTPLGEENQPSVESATATSKEGDRVSVLIKDHNATVIGNVTSPAVNSSDVETSITNFDIAIGEQIQANRAYFKELIGDDVKVNNLTAAIISVVDLIATEADIEDLIAGKITVTDLIATKIDADVVISDKAIIENLKTKQADILSLLADKATIEKLIANKANIKSLIAEEADLKYANIDFANIDKATMEYFYASSGLIQDVVIGDASISGYLIGVTIKGDLIEGGTVVADKLVIKGEDGIYYKLNTNGETIETEQTEYNSLNGSIITAKSVTAEKISVKDLVAFGATIGGFNITENSLYSGVKESVENTTAGIYLDNDGQVAFGDSNNFLKFYKDDNGTYKLAISAESIHFGAGKEFTLNDDGMTIEGTSDDNNSKIKTNISNNGMTVYANDDEKLKADDKGVEATDLHAKTYLIIGGNSRLENYGDNRTGCFWIGN